MLTAYLDESGYGSKEILVVGGFLGNDQEWLQTEQDWKAALGKRKSLHMKELRWGKKVNRTKELLERLGPVPHQCGLVPVWSRLRVSDYADLIDSAAVNRKLQHGYFFAAQYVGMMMFWWACKLNERIKVVFEHNEHFAEILPVVLKSYGDLFPFFKLKDGSSCVSGVEMVPKDSTCLTEPADYLTYARLQQLRDPESLRARACEPIIKPQPGLYVEVSREVIRSLMLSRTQRNIRHLGRRLTRYLEELRRRRTGDVADER